jgi:hypothetical protein
MKMPRRWETNAYWSEEDQVGLVEIFSPNFKEVTTLYVHDPSIWGSQVKWSKFVMAHTGPISDMMDINFDFVYWGVRQVRVSQMVPRPKSYVEPKDTHKNQEAYRQTFLSKAATQLPGIDEIVTCPACEGSKEHAGEIMQIVIHLNDGLQVPREVIADWLDLLYAAGVDLAFKVTGSD